MSDTTRHPTIPGILVFVTMFIAAFTGCKDDEPTAPSAAPKEPSVSVINVLAPRVNEVFGPRPEVQVVWDTVAATSPDDSVFIDYRSTIPSRDWKRAVRLPVKARAGSFGIPDTAVTVFEIRFKCTRDSDWQIVSPLYVAKSVLTMLSPKSQDAVEIGREVRIRWMAHAPYVPDSLQPRDDSALVIEYLILQPNQSWRAVGAATVAGGRFDWPLPAWVTSDFALRLRPVTSPAWTNISPIHVTAPTVTITSPLATDKCRIGGDIEIAWSGGASMLETDEVLLEYLILGGWHPIGTFPYTKRRIQWKHPFSTATVFGLGATLLRGGKRSAVYGVKGVEMRFDFPAGAAFARGAPLVVPIILEIPNATSRGTEYLLSTDGGRTWPVTKFPGDLIDEGPASQCRLRARRADLPFEDTSAVFSITEDLVDYDPFVIGRHYQYAVTERIWIIFAGNLSPGGCDHPDLHIVPTGKRELGDRTEYDVTVWGGRITDTLRTVVTISKSGMRPSSASFLPWSYTGLFTRLDPGANGKEYSWKGGNHFILDRSRGLVYAFGPGVPSIPSAISAEYFFRLK